jgi:hypothetical protein
MNLDLLSAERCFPSAAAQGQASLRSGEIVILDSTGNLERTIPFTEADRKL